MNFKQLTRGLHM